MNSVITNYKFVSGLTTENLFKCINIEVFFNEHDENFLDNLISVTINFE